VPSDPPHENWSYDPDLAEWLLGVHLKQPRWAGRFLTSVASAARHADAIEYAIIRPLLLELKQRHPQYRATIAAPNSSKPE
jgi:hypothetical protein